MTKRIGIIGGTFNPVHYGHLRVAEEAREALGLARVLFIPVALPALKLGGQLAGAGERFEMVSLAVKDNPYFGVSDIEIARGGRSYTIDTLRELKKGSLGDEAGEDIATTVILGSDVFNEITTWHEFEQLFTLTDFAVVPRPGFPANKIEQVLPVELAREFWYDDDLKAYASSYGHRVRFLVTTLFDISSSGIRRVVGSGQSVRYLVPPAVEDYIIEKGLYKQARRDLPVTGKR